MFLQARGNFHFYTERNCHAARGNKIDVILCIPILHNLNEALTNYPVSNYMQVNGLFSNDKFETSV